MHLSSTVTRANRSTVCPNEAVTFYCATNGPDLIWKLPSISGLQTISNFYNDNDVVHEIAGPNTNLTTRPILRSQVELPYSPKLNNKLIICKSGNISNHLLYKLAGIIIASAVA